MRCVYVVALLLTVSAVAQCAGVHGRSVDALLYYETLSHHVSRVTRQADLVHLQFAAFNMTFETELSPSQEGFHPNAKFTYMGKDVEPYTFYKGRLQGEPHSVVRGHVINGLFEGVVHSNGIAYHIEHATKYFDTEQSFHSVIYRAHDVHVPDSAGCGRKGDILKNIEATQAKARPTREDPIVYGRSRYKRQVTSNGNLFCQMRISADHLFLSNIGRGDVQATMAEMVAIMTEVQTIFRQTDFNQDGTVDGIVPVLAQVDVLDQNDPSYLFSSTSIGVEDYLDRWSRIDHSAFCLALLLTYRDFANGVLGLAWVAQPPGGNRGGICEDRVTLNMGPRYLNTAIVTMLNYGQRQPRAVTIITTAHELGHNFGSPHDPSTTECSPGFGRGGNYIMFPSATDGAQPNNEMFSPCSRQMILAVLQSSRSDCFTATGSFCGNSQVEEGEACDCGNMCDQDPCCTVDCELTPGSVCSPSQICCDDTCQYKGQDFQCREATDCGLSVNCSGTSAMCGDPMSRGNPEDVILCNNNMNLCVDGVCSGSLCLRQGLEDCECSLEAIRCDVCCLFNEQCQSSFNIPLIERGQRRDPGRSCNNFEGYCDRNGDCQVVDNEGTLNDLLDIFTLDTLNTVVAWLAANWYIPVAVLVGLVILIILLQVTYRRRKPIKRKFRQARNSIRRGRDGARGGVSEAQTGGVGAGASREPRQAPQRQISPREAMNRLSHFFPNADRSVIQTVIENTRSESKAVKKLLDRGYPMRRVPIPHA